MKLERLISMIYMLLNHEILSASELADKYNVSQRTIYRDIETICAAGIPVVSYQGTNGGYGIMEEYKMDRSLLGSYDVASLVSVLQSMLQLLRDAIASSRLVQFGYINAKNERAERSVEPVQLLYKNNCWYLYGYCKIRSDYREFRLSRMTDLKTTGHYFHAIHKLHEEKPWEYALQENKRLTVSLRFSATSLARALDQLPIAEKQFHEDGSLSLRIEVDERALSTWMLHLVLSFGEDIEVIEPPELREQLKNKLQKMINLYKRKRLSPSSGGTS